MALPSISHGLETCDILELLKQPNGKEVCNSDSGRDIRA